jgi:SulP family sulfate permease
MVINGLVLGMLGCIDALLTSVIADSLTRTEHDSDKELIGQGIGNLMSGLFGGIAGAGATMGTVVNIQTGGRTALSGLTRAVILLVVVVWAAPLTASIPLAVLAGIALKVGLEYHGLGLFETRPQGFLERGDDHVWRDHANRLCGSDGRCRGRHFCCQHFDHSKAQQIRAKDVKAITDADDAIILTPEEQFLMNQADGKVLLFHLSGPMIFGVAKAISREHSIASDFGALIFDLSDVPHLGVTSSLAIENAIIESIEQGRHVFIVGAAGQTKDRLQDFGVLQRVPAPNRMGDRTEAIRQAVSLVRGEASDHPQSIEPVAAAVQSDTGLAS